MRSYEHHPDVTWIEDRVRFTSELLESARRTAEAARAQASPDPLAAEIALSFAVQRIQYGWALGETPPELSTLLDEAAALVREAAQRTRQPTAPIAERWICTALIARDHLLAVELASRVPADVADLEMQFPVARDFLVGLARLVEADWDAVREAATAIERASSGEHVSPAGARSYDGLGELLRATADRDERAFDGAVAVRAAALVGLYGHSPQARRHPSGLLDLQGAAVAIVGASIGLRPSTPSVPLASELSEAGEDGLHA